MSKDTVHKEQDEPDCCLDICRVTHGAYTESYEVCTRLLTVLFLSIDLNV